MHFYCRKRRADCYASTKLVVCWHNAVCLMSSLTSPSRSIKAVDLVSPREPWRNPLFRLDFPEAMLSDLARTTPRPPLLPLAVLTAAPLFRLFRAYPAAASMAHSCRGTFQQSCPMLSLRARPRHAPHRDEAPADAMPRAMSAASR